MSLYLKYRPQTLSELKGNAEIVSSLEGMLKDLNTCPHTFLLFGPTGTGKTTIARIIANRVGCVGNDFNEINASDHTGVDDVREIIKNSQFQAMEGESRVWLIDECHRFSPQAQDSLLKILEDTPRHVYFILCTTEPNKLKITIRGRCQQFQTKPLNETQMIALLKRVCRDEGESVGREILEQINESSTGLPRNALQTLEQVLSVGEEQRMELAQQATEEQTQGIELCRALIQREKWGKVSKILVGLKEQDPENIRRVVLGYCQAILLKGDDPVAGLVMDAFMEPTYNSGFPQIVFNCYSIIKT